MISNKTNTLRGLTLCMLGIGSLHDKKLGNVSGQVRRSIPGGGDLIFLYMRRLGSFLGVQNFEFQYFLGFSEK